MKKSILNIAAVAAIVLVSFTSCEKKSGSGAGENTDSTAIDSTVNAVDSTVNAVDSTVKAVDSTVTKAAGEAAAKVDSAVTK